jgi:hypothetical protein
VTVAAFENAVRAAGKAFADDESLAFAWDNSPPKDPTAAPTLVWSFGRGLPEQITNLVVVHRGTVDATFWLPLGSGLMRGMELATALGSEFAGEHFAGGQVLHEVQATPLGRDGDSYRTRSVLPWEFVERVVPVGMISNAAPDALGAVQAIAQRWESAVRAPLNLTTYDDNSPPAVDAALPYAFRSTRILAPVHLETGLLRVLGRVEAILQHKLGSGVQLAEQQALHIERAFHQITFRGLCFGTPTVTRVGRTALDTWQTNVRLPFHYDVRT